MLLLTMQCIFSDVTYPALCQMISIAKVREFLPFLALQPHDPQSPNIQPPGSVGVLPTRLRRSACCHVGLHEMHKGYMDFRVHLECMYHGTREPRNFFCCGTRRHFGDKRSLPAWHHVTLWRRRHATQIPQPRIQRSTYPPLSIPTLLNADPTCTRQTECTRDPWSGGVVGYI